MKVTLLAFFVFICSCTGWQMKSKTTFEVVYKGETYTCSVQVLKEKKTIDIANECVKL